MYEAKEKVSMPKGMIAQRVTRAKQAVAAKATTKGRAVALAALSARTEARKVITPEQIRDLRQQLSPDPEKLLPQQRFSQLLGVSWSTIARWEAGGALDSRHALKLARLQRVLLALDDMVAREYRLPFFEQPHPLLMQLRPIDLLDTEEGAAAVIRQLEAAATGSFA
jgi:DNA-binding transcriptional regulator YiaG